MLGVLLQFVMSITHGMACSQDVNTQGQLALNVASLLDARLQCC